MGKLCAAKIVGRKIRLTLAFSCGARSAFKLKKSDYLRKHAIAPSAARLC
jgi:hypothetical protein